MKTHTVYQYQKTTMTNPRSEKKKLPRLKRVSDDEVPGFRLQPRDVEILRTVYEYRAMSTPQIDALFFPSKGERSQAMQVSSRCLHRLKMLFHAGYLKRVEQAQTLSEGRKPLVYFLDTDGARYLAHLDKCTLDDLKWDRQEHEVGPLFLDHLLLSNDIRIAVILAARKYGYELKEWRDEPSLRSVHQKEKVKITGGDKKQHEVPLIPDGYFVLDTADSVDHFFLEVDRATEPLYSADLGRRAWARKVAAYLQFYRSGDYEARYGTKGLRILTITTSEQRLNQLKKVTEKVGGKSRFWFTTFDRITSAKILTEPIWQKASFGDWYSLVW